MNSIINVIKNVIARDNNDQPNYEEVHSIGINDANEKKVDKIISQAPMAESYTNMIVNFANISVSVAWQLITSNCDSNNPSPIADTLSVTASRVWHKLLIRAMNWNTPPKI